MLICTVGWGAQTCPGQDKQSDVYVCMYVCKYAYIAGSPAQKRPTKLVLLHSFIFVVSALTFESESESESES
jgi:hypothetical protein